MDIRILDFKEELDKIKVDYSYIQFNNHQIEQMCYFLNNFGKEDVNDLLVKSKNARNLATQYFSKDTILNKFLNHI